MERWIFGTEQATGQTGKGPLSEARNSLVKLKVKATADAAS